MHAEKRDQTLRKILMVGMCTNCSIDFRCSFVFFLQFLRMLQTKLDDSKPIVTKLLLFISRYIFYRSGRSSLSRINLNGKDKIQFKVKIQDSLVELDFLRQKLFFYRKSHNINENVYSANYDGVFLKSIQLSAIKINIRTLAVFGDFFYMEGLEMIQEVNVTAGVVYRNISLPRPRFHVNNIVVIEQSQYPTGKKQNLLN